jgi:hypothetical protein
MSVMFRSPRLAPPRAKAVPFRARRRASPRAFAGPALGFPTLAVTMLGFDDVVASAAAFRPCLVRLSGDEVALMPEAGDLAD